MPIEIQNFTQKEFVDISAEEYRIYKSLVGGFTYIINEPQWLAVSTHGHYVVDIDGFVHYIPFETWNVLTWKTRGKVPTIVR